MTAPIVVNIPGAKLLSKELSKNARIHPLKKARITAKHRTGTNGRVVCELVDHDPVVISRLRTRDDGRPCFTAYTLAGELYRAGRVTLARIAPKRYSADGDNLQTLLSSIRDGLADALGVNDKVFVTNPTEEQRNAGAIGIEYHQIDGPWGVRITIEPA
jgi:hypothetical protein